MGNTGYITLEQMSELADYFDIDTEGRSAIAIEADIKKGLETIKNGFMKIINIIWGWLKNIWNFLRGKKTCAAKPKTLEQGTKLIGKADFLIETAKKVLNEEPERKSEEKVEKEKRDLDEAKKDVEEQKVLYLEVKNEENTKKEVAKVPVQTSKVENNLKKIEISLKDVTKKINENESKKSKDGKPNIFDALVSKALQAMLTGLTMKKMVLDNIIKPSQLRIEGGSGTLLLTDSGRGVVTDRNNEDKWKRHANQLQRQAQHEDMKDYLERNDNKDVILARGPVDKTSYTTPKKARQKRAARRSH